MNTLTSEGVLFKKPARNADETKSSRRKRKHHQRPGKVDEEVLRSFEEPASTIPRRMALYNKCLKELDDIFEDVQDKHNRELSEKYLKFIESSLRLAEQDDRVLPIGIIESGLSTRENASIFDFLVTKLKSHVKTLDTKVLIARIDSSTTSSTKAIFQSICSQIMKANSEKGSDDNDLDAGEDKEDEEEEEEKEESVKKKEQYYSLYDIKKFLSEQDATYRLFLFIEEVEYFSDSVISQLLTLMGCADVPAIFVLGSTHGHFVGNLIPSNIPSQFVLEKIYSVSPEKRLNDFMKLVLFNSPIPFRLSGGIVSLLQSIYKEENFSLEFIKDCFKLCLQRHFLSAKSALCSFKRSDKYLEDEKQVLLKVIRENFTEGSPRKRARGRGQTSFDEIVDASVDGLRNWFLMLHLFKFINGGIPELPLGDSFSQIYVSCSQDRVKKDDNEDPFQRLYEIISSNSKGAFHEFLDESISFLESSKKLPDTPLRKEILNRFEEILKAFDDGEKERNDSKLNESVNQVIKFKKREKLDKIKETLQERMRQNEGTSVLYECKKQLTTYLKELAKVYMPPLASLPLSEAFIFSDVNMLINTLFPACFLRLNEDLTCPNLMLKCKCCASLPALSVDSSLPDVCILHKLISEHTTKKVDLNLVYSSFLACVKPEERKSKRVPVTDSATASFLIRFRRGIGELQHMGFLKRSKSKPDEITRLTWW